MKETVERLHDIHEAIVRIEKYTQLGRTSLKIPDAYNKSIDTDCQLDLRHFECR